MSTRRAIGPRERLAIFHGAGGICHICGEAILVSDKWDVEHVIPLEMGGDEKKGSANLRPAHASCHKAKTAKVDVPQIAKAKRREAKHLGARKRSTFGSTKWKRKVDGTVERRDG